MIPAWVAFLYLAVGIFIGVSFTYTKCSDSCKAKWKQQFKYANSIKIKSTFTDWQCHNN